ncbi:MAG: DNA mismatch repair endonuclease MutL [Desulfuromonadaceae bacterium]|nr:DNA mismatch repair endonuclease MutL [Desulfuromonadaceae bacterium]MDD2856662.1 DNA mismatch repair endonuclease MutL [Desulfuromonadaceae bacterium]
MSTHISILPEILTNKIAAGEVVERPASVIKELIENALDAGATEISVEVTAGGRRRIRVTDNGSGMSREDALLSIERHATSKIKHDGDLEKIMTLGFRGEALPSIASVSRFTLSTREPDSQEGTEIVVEAGRIRDVKACGMPAGTVISVENLFYNLPVRLKFMKSPETEIGHVADVVNRMAVARPDVGFSCFSDDRELLRLQSSDLLRRLSQVIGKQSSQHFYPIVNTVSDYVKVRGFVAGPAVVRSGTQAVYTYINGRYIRDKVVQHAVMQAYRGVIDRGRYPVVALFIELPPEEVDVNVHPTKHEVRFRRQSVVHDAIQAEIEGVLRDSPWLIKNMFKSEDQPERPLNSQVYRERVAASAQASLEMQPQKTFYPKQLEAIPAVSEKVELCQFAEWSDAAMSPGYFSSLLIIGQFNGEYILCQSDKDLVIIDQHAASERVAYQNLKQQSDTDGVESQQLLFPETLELTFSEVAIAARYSKWLADIGFDVEPFGGATVVIKSVPRVVVDKDPVTLVRNILADIENLGTSAAFNDHLEHLLSKIACHSVIRGVHKLDQRQIKELFYRMDQTGFSASCPHGRPVSHIITLQELQKIFKRT